MGLMVAVDERCFCCDDKINGRAVIWSGYRSRRSRNGRSLELCFHADCAAEFLRGFTRDVVSLYKGEESMEEGWFREMGREAEIDIALSGLYPYDTKHITPFQKPMEKLTTHLHETLRERWDRSS